MGWVFFEKRVNLKRIFGGLRVPGGISWVVRLNEKS
jgi:hypothetical protein